MTTPLHVAVIGGGPMGLACAYQLLKAGQRVTLLEAGPRLGGMSASFDFNGVDIERYFHFICGTDHDYFELLGELGLLDSLRWQRTRMGLFHQGKLHAWGSPMALLKFPHLDFLTKFRYGLQVMVTKQRKQFDDLEHTTARAWLEKWLGKKGYRILWEQLFALKFYEFQDQLSAAWIATRIQRVALSRESLLHERLGYLEGRTQSLIDALEHAIRTRGGTIRVSAPVRRITTSDGRVTGVDLGGETLAADRVISTVPFPYVPQMLPDLPEPWLGKLQSIANVGVCTLVFKLKQPLTPNFWTNITDPSLPIPGIIEYSNLNPITPHIAYVPYYMPQTHPKYQWTLEQFQQELLPVFAAINPQFRPDWILDAHLSRYQFAQTVCRPGFASLVPPLDGVMPGLLLADTSSYYPQDRSVSESVRVGRLLAEKAVAPC